MSLNTHLLLVDPQNDFCDIAQAALPVPGADADLKRAAQLIARCGGAFSRIHVTLDSHNALDIAHPSWWVDAAGRHPDPFTVISEADVAAGQWRTADPAAEQGSLDYVRALAERNKHQLIVWPEHCLIGTPGHNVHASLMDELNRWGRRYRRTPRFTWKGITPTTEHYSAVQAEVPDPNDARTLPDPAWLAQLAQADRLLVAGQALSHCVANTVRDLVALLGPDSAQKIMLLTDCTSSISGFENFSADFIDDMTQRGMQLADSQTVRV